MHSEEITGMSPQAAAFYTRLTAEVCENSNELDPTTYDTLGYYYRRMRDNTRLRPLYQYNWVRRTSPMANLISNLPPRREPWRVLDAGCGTGTEALFWSTLREDLEVTGVDITAERANTARARQVAYEQRLGRSLNLRFLEQDVFTVLDTHKFDLVWVMEAISHIDPAERFLDSVYKSLGSSGYLVVSDSHLLNPAMAWYVYKLRRQGIAERTEKVASSGESFSYAQERLFTVGQMARLLKSTGFRSVDSQLSVFVPPAAVRGPAAPSLVIRLDAWLSRVPLLRNLGGIYTMIAKV